MPAKEFKINPRPIVDETRNRSNRMAYIRPGRSIDLKSTSIKIRLIRRVTLYLTLLLLGLGALSGTSFPTMVHADGPVGATTSDLKVIASSPEDIGSGYLQVVATMSGNLTRNDGSEGSYKVPVILRYPQDVTDCNGIGLLDVINSVFYETFETAGTQADHFFPSIFPFASLILGDEYIQSHGYVYAQAQWNKLVIERQKNADPPLDPPPDPTLHIDQGTDGYFILRDLSHFLRTPADLLDGPAPTPCASDDVIAFGYSQTGMLLRQFYFAELNTTLANNQAFDEGLVFEGSLHGVPGSHCRSLSNESPWFSYSFMGCGGETPGTEGKVITVNTETDIQFDNGRKARPDEERSHYRVYEIAGTSHIPTPLFPLKQSGVRPMEMGTPEQNYADIAPVFRAMMQHFQDWLAGSADPPPSVFLEGRTGHLDTPLFSSNSWGSDGTQVLITKLGDDENVLGGVRLPHVRTTLPDEQQIGGPLGLYRGTECYNDPLSGDYILNCDLYGDENIYNMAGGTFKPYTEFNPDLCTTFYDSYQTFVDAVTQAAEYAAAEGWVLAEEVDDLVSAAELKAAEYPGCVPSDPN